MTRPDPAPMPQDIDACRQLFRTGRYAEADLAARALLADLQRPLAERAELLRMRSMALAEVGRHAEAFDAAETLARETALAADPGLALAAAQALGACFERIGDPWQAARVLGQALEEHGEAAPRRERVLAEVAQGAFLLGAHHRLGDAGSEAERAELLARAVRHTEAARARPLEGEPLYQVVVDGNLGEMKMLQGDVAGAGPLLDDALALAERHGYAPYALRCRASRIEWLVRAGRAAEAHAEARAVLAALGADGGPVSTRVRALSAAALACRQLGLFEEALEHFMAFERTERRRTLAEQRAQASLFVSRAEAERQRLRADDAQDRARRLSHHASEAAQRAERDPLTGLGNRDHLARRAAELGHDPAAQPVALAMLDLDGFKAVNDAHGHGAGDALLVALAETMRHALRAGDVLCRLGGDEFVLLLPGAGPQRAREVAERIAANVRRAAAAQALEAARQVTVSIGLATAQPGDLPASLARADAALYRAKRAGRDRVEADRA